DRERAVRTRTWLGMRRKFVRRGKLRVRRESLLSEAKMSEVTVQGTEHWTRKGDVRLFLWRKSVVEPREAKGTILFVHGSSMASQPTFDLHVHGPPQSSALESFVRPGFSH